MKGSGRFEGYRAAALRKDVVSGLIVGVIAIPLGMAFAIAAGVKPEYGLYTTIVAGALISLLGGSKYQIGGPTGAFIPILLSIVLVYGYENLLAAGLLAGIILVVMGLCRLGSLIRYIPGPVIVGFTTGIAVIIFTGQIPGLLGLEHVEKHESFVRNVQEIFLRIDTWNPYSLLVSAAGFAVILAVRRYWPRVPAALLGLMAATAVSALLPEGQVATIGSTFGDIPSALPSFRLPDLSWDNALRLLQPALMIALLGGIESLLSAVVADKLTGARHNGNRELIGQGIANIAAPLFGGIPATGAIARTAANIKSGAASPLSGVVHSAVVLLVLLLFAPYASRIPMAAMVPILMMVAWDMSERRSFAQVLRSRSLDSVVLLVSFLLTVFVNLIAGVGIGTALAWTLYWLRGAVARTSSPKASPLRSIADPRPLAAQPPQRPATSGAAAKRR